MRIVGWQIQTWTDEFPGLGYVKKSAPVEFGNSPVRDKAARLAYIADLVGDEEVFSIVPIVR